MTSIGVCSLKGSPGSTTLVTLLAAVWGSQRRVLVEADIDGSTLLPRYPAILAPEPNLATLAAACRHGIDEEALWRNTQRLYGTVDVIIGAEAPRVTARAVADLADHLGELPTVLPAVDWFWDLGRFRVSSLPDGLCETLDRLVIVVRPEFEAVEPLIKRCVEIESVACQVGVVTVGDGGVSEAELASALASRTSGRITIFGHLPAASRAAAVWNAAPGVTAPIFQRRKFAQGPLVVAARRIRDELCRSTSSQVLR